MRLRDNLLLVGLVIFTISVVTYFQHSPGYIDAEYYFVTGKWLLNGWGFNQPFLWNYLDQPINLPHPSHAYWNPLASFVSMLGMAISGRADFGGARLGFLLAAILLPPLTARLAFDLTQRRDQAMISGLLAVFPPYLTAVFSTTDNFSLLALLGAIYFLIKPNQSRWQAIGLGLVCGLMNLARADAILWAAITGLALLFPLIKHELNKKETIFRFVFFVVGYGLIMSGWWWRNWQTFGVPIAPGGSQVLWMLNYNDLFTYPASVLTPARFWSGGVIKLLSDRCWALGQNLGNTLAVQGGIVSLPFILVGLYALRDRFRVRLAVFAWLLLTLTLSLFFPFVGARGGYFHGAVIFQPLWWAITPVGLDKVVGWARGKGFFTPQAFLIFRSALLVFTMAISALILIGRLKTWDVEYERYTEVEQFLSAYSTDSAARVMVVNPAAFYSVSGREGIVHPEGDVQTALDAAQAFDVTYLILEKNALLAWAKPLFTEGAEIDGLNLIKTEKDWVVYEFEK